LLLIIGELSFILNYEHLVILLLLFEPLL